MVSYLFLTITHPVRQRGLLLFPVDGTAMSPGCDDVEWA